MKTSTLLLIAVGLYLLTRKSDSTPFAVPDYVDTAIDPQNYVYGGAVYGGGSGAAGTHGVLLNTGTPGPSRISNS